jgi:DNA-binding GntR family transcriptional regulator
MDQKAMKAPGIPRIGRQSAAAGAAEALRQAILSGELLMGQSLSEAQLGESLGVSRTPLREALLELEGQGLIQIAPYKGAHVFSLTEGQISQLGAFRKTLELAALDSAMRLDAAALANAMQPVIVAMTKAIDGGDTQLFGELDTKLHECIIACSGNEYLIHAYHLVALKLAVLRMLVSRDTETLGRSQEDHADLLRHVHNGHLEEARALLSRHIDGGTSFYADNTRSALELRVVGR